MFRQSTESGTRAVQLVPGNIVRVRRYTVLEPVSARVSSTERAGLCLALDYRSAK